MLVRPLSILIPSQSSLRDIDQHVLDAKTSFAQMRNDQAYDNLKSQMIVYRITDSERSHTGIVLGVNLSEFDADSIVHHESTMPSKVSKQAMVAKEQGGFSKPILLTHRSIPIISQLFERYTQQHALVDIYLEKYNATHQIWPITNAEDIETIKAVFSVEENGYIVDGHHRTRAIQQLGKDSEIQLQAGLCALFDIDQLDILPFHRIVDIEMPSDQFLNQLRQVADLTRLSEPRLPTSSDEIILLIDDHIYNLRWKMRPTDSFAALDVNMLSNLVLKDILKITNESTSSFVHYLEGDQNIDGIHALIYENNKVAFLLHPLSTEEFINTVNKGHILPPKSTWFLPRMANGIVSMTWK